MKKIDYPCPCGGKIRWTKERVTFEGVDCGVLEVEVCDKCGEEYLPDESMGIVEKKMKEAGLWGIERKKVSFWKSGNSVILRIPARIARILGLKPSMEGYITQEGKHKIVIEV